MMLTKDPTKANLLIDDATAWDYFNRLDTAEGDERRQMADALQEYANDQEAKERKRSEDHFERLYTDKAYFDGLSNSAFVKGVSKYNPSPETVHYGGANRAFLSFFNGRELKGLEYDIERDGYAQAFFGKQGSVSDKEFFQLVGEQFKKKRLQREANEALQGDAVVNAFEDLMRGTIAPTAHRVKEFRDRNKEAFEGANEAELLSSYSQIYNNIRAGLEPYQEQAKQVFDILSSATGADAGGMPKAGNAEIEQLADGMAGLYPAEREMIYQAVALASKSLGRDQKSGFQMLAESLGRGISDMTGKTTLAAQEKALRVRRENFSDDKNTVLINEQGRPYWSNDAVLSGIAGTEPGPEWRKASPEERSKLVADIDAMLKRAEIVRELRSIAEGAVDPINPKSGTLVEKIGAGTIAAARSLPYTATAAIPAAGPALVGAAIYGSEYDRMRLAYPDLDPSAAEGLAATSAALQAPIEWIQSKAFFGKLPVTAGILKRMSDVRLPLPVRVGTAIGGNILEQNAQEWAQDAVPLVIDDISAAIRSDMPEFDADKAFQGFKESRLDTFFAVLPLALIGGGAATFREFRRGEAFTADVGELRKFGFSEEVSKSIAAEPDPETRDRMIVEEAPNRKPEDIAAAIKTREAEAEAVKSDQEDPSKPTLESALLVGETDAEGNPVREYIVKNANGSEYSRHRDFDAARQAFVELNSVGRESFRLATRQIISFYENLAANGGRDVQIDFAGAPKTVADAIAENPQAAGQLQERMRIEGLEGVDPATVQILGETTVEQIEEDVYRTTIKLYEGANPRTVVEESIEGKTREALASGRVSMDWLRSEIEAYQNVSGESLLTESDQSVIEAVSTLGEAYFAGRVRERSLPDSLRSFFRQLAVFFRDVFTRAIKLKKAIAEGAVSGDFEAFVADAAGVPLERRIEGLRARSQEALLSGQTFSIQSATMPKEAADLAAAETIAAQLIGKELENRSTGFQAVLSKNSLAKMVSESAVRKSASPEAHAQAIANIDRLFESAEFVETHGDTKGDKNLKAVHRFWAPMVFGDTALAVKITAKETANPGQSNRLYSIEAIDVEMVKPAGQLAHAPESSDAPIAGFKENVRLLADEVKSKGKTFSIATKEQIARIEAQFEKLNKAPEQRIQLLERAKKRFLPLLEENRGILEGIASRDVSLEPAAALDQLDQERAATLADLDIEEQAGIEASGAKIVEQFAQRIEEAKTDSTRKALEREAKARAIERRRGIEKQFSERRKAVNAEFDRKAAQVKSEAQRAESAGRQQRSRELQHAKLIQSIAELDALLSVFPAEIRGKVGGFAKLANIGTGEKALAGFFVKRVEMIDTELERMLKKEYTEKILSLVKRNRPKKGDNGVKKSTLGAEKQALADMVHKATLMDEDATAKRMLEIEASGIPPELAEEWGVLNTFGDLDNRTADSLATAHVWLADQFKAGREAWRIKEQARVEQQREQARKTVEWIGGPTARARFAEKSLLLRMRDAANSYLLDHNSFEQFVTALFPPDVAARMAKTLRKNDTASQVAEIREREAILNAVKAGAKAAGISTGKALAMLKESQKDAVPYWDARKVKDERIAIDLAEKILRGEADASYLTAADLDTLRDELAALPADTQKEFVTIKRVISAGRPVKLDMSRAKAIQLLLSWDQLDVQNKMRREGWTDDSAKALQALTADPVSQAVLSHARELYASGHAIVNPVYSRMFGMNMPQVRNYAPSRFLHAGDVKEIGLDGSPTATGSTPGFAKSRVSHSSKIAPADALTVMQQHVMQQTHWVHFAELAREFRALLTTPDVRESIKQHHGEGVLRTAELWADQLEQRGGNRAREVAWLNSVLGTFISGKAVAALGFNLKTISMQIENAIRFGLSLTPRQMVSAFSDPAGLAQDVAEVWNSPAIQTRLRGGATAEARFLFDRYSGKGLVASKIAEISMAPINWMDSASTTLSAAVVYRGTYKDAIADGVPEKIARDAALDAAAASIYRFAQPVSFGQKSMVENTGNILTKMFFLFMSDPRLKTSILADAVRGLATGQGNAGDHVRRIVAIEVMALISHVISSAFRDAFTDDEDEDIWGVGGFARALALAPLQGFFLVGTASEVVISKLVGEQSFIRTQNPLIDTVQSADRAFRNIEDTFNPDDPDAMLKEWNAIFRTLAVAPAMAVPAVLLNAVKPIIGAAQNIRESEN